MLKFLLIVIWASVSYSQSTGCELTYEKWCKSLKGGFAADANCNDADKTKAYNEACDLVNKHNKMQGVTYRLKVNRRFHLKHLHGKSAECPILDKPEDVSYLQNIKRLVFDRFAKKRLIDNPKIRDQGSCGSCYAMAAVGLVEAWYAKRNETVELSVANVVSCSKNHCGGGTVHEALQHLQTTDIVKETDSPYKVGKVDYTKSECKETDSEPPVFKVASLTKVTHENIKKILVDGPIAVMMHTNIRDFDLYDSGIFEHRSCSTGNPEHAVLLVGYGYDESLKLPYWTIRNSWGEDWGENGHMRIKQGNGSNCLKLCDAVYLGSSDGVTLSQSADYRVFCFIAILVYVFERLVFT